MARSPQQLGERLWKPWFLVAIALVGCYQLVNGDIWWHLRTGELIAQRGEIPATDWFTYTNPDSRWIDLHWGFQWMMGQLYALGGSPYLILAKVLAGVLTFALLLSIQPPNMKRWLVCLRT